MSGTGITAVIGDLYEASSSGGNWFAFGREFFQHLGVDSGSLRVRDADGRHVNVLQPVLPWEGQYSRFQALDPVRGAALRTIPSRDWGTTVKLGTELLPNDTFMRSDFYQEFAKPLGRNHLLLGTIGDIDKTLILLFRETIPFTERDKQNLASMLPHMQRAVQLHNRLRGAELNAQIGCAAFEALPGGAIVLDHETSVLFINKAAERLLSEAGSPLALRRQSSQVWNAGALQLVIRDRSRAARLLSLVSDAARGGSGGAMRFEIESETDNRVDQLAVLVTPQPPQYSPRETAPGALRPVLILLKQLSRPSAPRASLLSDLFGLSIAESAVALALLGGQTAESVARERDVSLETVRSQIRTVLRKSEAANLRDFERIGALLASLGQ